MIASIRGTLLIVGTDYVIIEAGGVGYHIWAPKPIVQRLGNPGTQAFLHTLLIVREDAMTLYGFSVPEERAFFELLMTVSGVGPKVALAVLSAGPVDQLQRAIATENITLLSQVPGIGKKTAARLVLELKAKVGQTPALPAFVEQSAGVGRLNAEVQEILQSLGYSAIEAQSAVSALPADASTELEERLREALRYFGGL